MEFAIYTFMATLLFGPKVDGIFVLSDAKKEIYYVVEPTSREREIWNYLKDYDREQKAVDKAMKIRRKTVHELHLQRESTREDFLPVLEDARQDQIMIRADYIQDRLKVQEALTPKEWEEINKRAFRRFERGRRGNDLENAKLELTRYKPLLKLREVIEKRVSDPKQKANCLTAYFDFQERLVKELGEMNSQLTPDAEALKRQDITAEEMQAISERLLDYRGKVFLSLAQFRKKLKENSSESEWPYLAKAMLKLM